MTTTTAAEPTTDLRFGEIKIQNFKRIELFEKDLDGNHLVVRGPNRSGKTSILEGFMAALGLIKGNDIPEPIRNGADKATLTFELIEAKTKARRFVVSRHWTEGGHRWDIKTAAGEPVKATDFQKLVTENAANPISLLRLRQQDLIDEILRTYGVKPPVEKVREITGELHPAREGESASAYLERLSADKFGVYYVERLNAHRVMVQKQGALAEQQEIVERMKPVDGQAASTSDLVKEIQALQQKGDERRAVRNAAEDKRRLWQEQKDNLDGLRREIAGSDIAIAGLEAQIAALQKQIAAIKEENGVALARISKGEKIVANLEAEAVAAEEAFKRLPDPAPEIAEVQAKIQDAEANAKRRMEWEVAQKNLLNAEGDSKAANHEHERLELIMQQFRDLRRTLLDGFDLGLEKVEIVDGNLRSNGVPFEQASTEEKITAACAIAFRKKPGCHVAILDDGEHLDRVHRDHLFREANRHGCQIILSMVTEDGEREEEIVEAA